MTEVDYRTGEFAWKDTEVSGAPKLTHVRGSVVFDGVTFGYEENETVLKNISLYAKPGQKIAFAGSTGSGKSTKAIFFPGLDRKSTRLNSSHVAISYAVFRLKNK